MNIRIVDFSSKYKDAFRDLNKEWIEKYFKMEESDYKMLDHPEENIIRKGGAIMIATVNDQPAAVAALIKMKGAPYDFELAKMAVSPVFQGQGLGALILQETIDKAKELGGKSIYIESNRKLVPAMKLYEKYGFKEIEGLETPYERCDIHLLLEV
jgi:GNAT superfamily N-acetyltransferase